MKEVGETTRQLMYDLNQILYDYTAEVTKKSRDYIWVTESLKNYGLGHPMQPLLSFDFSHGTTGMMLLQREVRSNAVI